MNYLPTGPEFRIDLVLKMVQNLIISTMRIEETALQKDEESLPISIKKIESSEVSTDLMDIGKEVPGASSIYIYLSTIMYDILLLALLFIITLNWQNMHSDVTRKTNKNLVVICSYH